MQPITVTASVFGGRKDKNRSAYDGHFITDTELAVALPYHFKKPPLVKVSANGKSAIAKVEDEGPWYDGRPGWPVDPYWETNSRPRAESDKRTNHAAIDLSPALAKLLGIDGLGHVTWEIIEDTVSVSSIPPQPPQDNAHVAPGATPFVQTIKDDWDVLKRHLEFKSLTPVEKVPLKPAPQPAPQGDAKFVNALIDVGTNHLDEVQQQAARKLLKAVGERYPQDGCAITLSCELQKAGIDVPDTYLAFALGNLLKKRGWISVPVGAQQPGDIGSTCGSEPHHGVDHVFLVLKRVSGDEMVVADNQAKAPHFRWTHDHGKSPTKFFLRAA